MQIPSRTVDHALGVLPHGWDAAIVRGAEVELMGKQPVEWYAVPFQLG